MGLRQCDKCTDMVDEAKAFCPSCGHAFVEEQKRTEPSVFESMEGTMQLGNTMYNQMLTDMGLNISSAPDKPDAAAHTVAEPVVQAPVQQVIQPAVQQVIQPAVVPAKPAGSGNTKWLIIAGVVLLLLFILLIVVGLIGFVVYTQYR